MTAETAIVPVERAASVIMLVRSQKVILDRDLAAMYGVDTKALNRAVQRNIDRFPADFMFLLSPDEWRRLRELEPKIGRGGRRTPPYAFTEQGVAMLSGLLNSPRAISVNIAIMRAFVQLRRLLASNEQLARKLRSMEKKYDGQFRAIFEAIQALMEPVEDDPPKRKIGFRAD